MNSHADDLGPQSIPDPDPSCNGELVLPVDPPAEGDERDERLELLDSFLGIEGFNEAIESTEFTQQEEIEGLIDIYRLSADPKVKLQALKHFHSKVEAIAKNNGLLVSATRTAVVDSGEDDEGGRESLRLTAQLRRLNESNTRKFLPNRSHGALGVGASRDSGAGEDKSD